MKEINFLTISTNSPEYHDGEIYIDGSTDGDKIDISILFNFNNPQHIFSYFTNGDVQEHIERYLMILQYDINEQRLQTLKLDILNFLQELDTRIEEDDFTLEIEVFNDDTLTDEIKNIIFEQYSLFQINEMLNKNSFDYSLTV